MFTGNVRGVSADELSDDIAFLLNGKNDLTDPDLAERGVSILFKETLPSRWTALSRLKESGDRLGEFAWYFSSDPLRDVLRSLFFARALLLELTRLQIALGEAAEKISATCFRQGERAGAPTRRRRRRRRRRYSHDWETRRRRQGKQHDDTQ